MHNMVKILKNGLHYKVYTTTFTLQEISMLIYNVRKLKPVHYKSPAFRDPNVELVFTGFLKEKCHCNYVAFKFCFFPNFFQIIQQKASLYWLVSLKDLFQ